MKTATSHKRPKTSLVPTNSTTSFSITSCASASVLPRFSIWPSKPSSGRPTTKVPNSAWKLAPTPKRPSRSGSAPSAAASSPSSSSGVVCPTVPRSAQSASHPVATGACLPMPAAPTGSATWNKRGGQKSLLRYPQIDIDDIGLPTSSTSTDRHRRCRLRGS